MPPWKQTAREMLPELAGKIEEAENPYLLWLDLLQAFDEAYRAEPVDESLLERLYAYAAWCANAPRGQTAEDDLLTCVCVCFYEKIPCHPRAWAHLPRWIAWDTFLAGEEVFRAKLSEAEFAALKEHMQHHRYQFIPKPAEPNQALRSATDPRP